MEVEVVPARRRGDLFCVDLAVMRRPPRIRVYVGRGRHRINRMDTSQSPAEAPASNGSGKEHSAARADGRADWVVVVMVVFLR